MKKKKDAEFSSKNIDLKLFSPSESEEGFIPWNKGEQGCQTFLKLKKGDETALLFSGRDMVMEAEVRRTMLRLANEGWENQGEVEIGFDGRSADEKEVEDLFKHDSIRVEIGMKLLPLVDPGAGSPLTDSVKMVRKEVVASTGFVLPGIRIADNMNIPPDNYIIYLKEIPIASGEIFLTRYLVLGNPGQLSQLKGWSVKDPVFGSQSLWIEPEHRDKADELGCLIMGPLNILVSHLRESLESNVKDLLGLQNVKELLERLSQSHPVVVEDFLKDKKKLRLVRKVLLNLVGERVSIRDLVTIMETIGDHEEQLEKSDLITEMVRISLARQICWSYLNEEGKISALSLSRKLEEKIQNSISETKHGFRLVLSGREADAMIKEIKKTLEDFEHPRVIFCDPPTRLYFRRLIEPVFPGLGILSTAEIARGIPIEILGEVDLPEGLSPASNIEKAGEDRDKKAGGLFGLIRV